MSLLTKYLSFRPNENQEKILQMIYSFLNQDKIDVFLLKGAAGTGKTSIIEAVTKYLNGNNGLFNLCAPTGRAVKIISDKTGQKALTLHKLLYSTKEIVGENGLISHVVFTPRENNSLRPMVYLIDESSMISDKNPSSNQFFVSQNSLLFDFIKYVKSGNGKNKIIFIGDAYQLPPVQDDFSPALSSSYLSKVYGLKIYEAELKDIVRQEQGSSVLTSALKVKNALQNKQRDFGFSFENTKSRRGFLNVYLEKHRLNEKQTIMLAWKNVIIDELNKSIRNLKFGVNSAIVCVGEHFMVNQNFYDKTIINKGTLIKVEEVLGLEDYKGFKFANVILSAVSGEEQISGKYKLSLTYLTENDSKRIAEREKQLYAYRMKENKVFRETKDKSSDSYLSAIQVKYGYAITVHKAQGGEWDNVFVYPDFPFGNMAGKWIYTAITRARKKIFSFKLDPYRYYNKIKEQKRNSLFNIQEDKRERQYRLL